MPYLIYRCRLAIMCLNPRVDFAFKLLFGSEENKDLLMSLINSVVSEEDQVSALQLKNPFNPKTYPTDKLSILDIRAQDQKGRHFNIEVQITDQLLYEKRALYYWSQVYSTQLQEGMGYRDLNKTIGIHVLNFNLMNEENYHNRYRVMNTQSQKVAFEDLEFHTIELEKFNKEFPQIKTALERWMVVLTKAHVLSSGDLPETLQTREVKKAMEVLERAHLSEPERQFYEGQLRWLRDEEAALEKKAFTSYETGKAEGKAEEARAIAKRLKEMKMTPSEMAAALGIPEKDLAALF